LLRSLLVPRRDFCKATYDVVYINTIIEGAVEQPTSRGGKALLTFRYEVAQPLYFYMPQIRIDG
jgi:hypothetical protein